MHHDFVVHDNLLYSWNITLRIYSDKNSLVDRYTITKHNGNYSFVFSENSEFKKQISDYLLNNHICRMGETISEKSPFAYVMSLTKETILSLL